MKLSTRAIKVKAEVSLNNFHVHGDRFQTKTESKFIGIPDFFKVEGGHFPRGLPNKSGGRSRIHERNYTNESAVNANWKPPRWPRLTVFNHTRVVRGMKIENPIGGTTIEVQLPNGTDSPLSNVILNLLGFPPTKCTPLLKTVRTSIQLLSNRVVDFHIDRSLSSLYLFLIHRISRFLESIVF